MRKFLVTRYDGSIHVSHAPSALHVWVAVKDALEVEEISE